MADRHDPDRSGSEPTENDSSVFDLFEPPPPSDPKSFGKIPVIKDAEIDLTDDGPSAVELKAAADVEAAGLQHWTAPPTGQLPAVLSDKDTNTGRWGDVAGPSWHGDDPSWSGPDLADVFADTNAIGVDDFVDDEDDEEEDDEYRRPSSATQTRPMVDSEAVSAPPLAAAPERRRPRESAERTDGQSPARSPRPASRRILDEGPAPRPGLAEEPTGWPTSPRRGPRPDRESRVRQQPRLPSASPAPAPIPSPAPAEPAARHGADGQDDQRAPRPGLERDNGPVRGSAPRLDQVPRPAPRGGGRGAGSNGGGADVTPAGPAGSPVERPGLFDEDRSIPSIDDIQFADSRPGPSGQDPHDPHDRRDRRGGVRDVRDPRSRRDRHEARLTPSHHGVDPGGHEGYVDEPIEGLESLDTPVGGRNLPAAVGVAAALVAVLLGAMWLGPAATLLLVIVLALVAVVELYNAMRMAGLRPAALLGIVATAAAPAVAFYRGDAAMPLIIGLTVVFGSLWYLVGADTERPVLNLSLTMMGILWIGGLASFAGLMLRFDGGAGIELLLAAIIITVASDTMAYIGGRAYGARPFHSASPNKTWEGTITGFLGAVFAGFAIGVTDMGSLWDGNLVPAMALGAVVGILAPIGDLAESVVKRDLGVKDMGHLLPGHGGVLDRVDALLFALPGAYYLAIVSGLV